mgnify:CR=1 FL=1
MIKTVETINIVWIVNDLYINNFITVYNECKNDKRFNLKILATTHIGLYKTDYVSSNQVYKFLINNGVDCINSWDSREKEYIDVSSFHPDYIFTTTPYDIYLPEPYKSNNLKKICKTCNVAYGNSMIKNSGIYKDFLKNNPYYNNLWMFFTADNDDYAKYIDCRYKSIGCLKIDEYLNYKRKPTYPWENPMSFKIVWKPRWTLDKNDSKLLDYIDKFYFYLKINTNVDFVFLFHPLLISNLKDKKYFKYFEKWIKKLNSLQNFRIENTSNFLDCVLSADVLIASHSSTIAEFATTGKPIIYIRTKTKLNNLGKKIMDTAYQTNNFSEIENILNNLQKGKDPMKIDREAAKNSYFTTPPKGLTVAQFLLKTLYDDFYNLKSRKEYETKLYTLNTEEIQKLKYKNDELSKALEKNKKIEFENKKLTTQIEIKQDQLDEVNQKYLEIINSISWKITKPLRKFKK